MKFVKTLKSRNKKVEDFEELKDILRDFSVKLVYLFGSHAGEEITKFSDVDVAILFEEGSDKRMDRLRVELMEFLGEEAIDLIDLDEAPPRLKYHIIKDGGILLGEDDSTEFEVKAMQEYFDFKPLEEKYFEKNERENREW